VTYDKERYANDPVYRAKLNAASKEWSDANRPRINARRRQRRVNDPKFARAVREDWLKTAYGITAAEFNAMVAAQGGRCFLCRRRPVQRLCVDHCHDTEMLRSLLCRRCNTGFGCFDDNPDLMRGGADYLEIWRLIHAMMGSSAKRIPRKTSKRAKKNGKTCRTSHSKNPKSRD
jgi:hypothetical protein